eukprot:scaffold193421_cov24-Tisochrysis_lutea.AAC.1
MPLDREAQADPTVPLGREQAGKQKGPGVRRGPRSIGYQGAEHGACGRLQSARLASFDRQVRRETITVRRRGRATAAAHLCMCNVKGEFWSGAHTS